MIQILLTIDGQAVDGACGDVSEAGHMSQSRQKSEQEKRTRERKSLVVHARFTVSEMAGVQRAATEAGMTLSAFIRSLTLEGAGISPFLTDEDRVVFELLREELRAIGVDLNGLTRMVYRGVVPSDTGKVIRALQVVVAGLSIELQGLAVRTSRKPKERP